MQVSSSSSISTPASASTGTVSSSSVGASTSQTYPALAPNETVVTTIERIQALLNSELKLLAWYSSAKKESAQNPKLAAFYEQCEQHSGKVAAVYKATIEVIKMAASLPIVPLQLHAFLLDETWSTMGLFQAQKQEMCKIIKNMTDSQPTLNAQEAQNLKLLQSYFSLGV